MKQLMAGLGLILLAVILVPVLQNMMTGALNYFCNCVGGRYVGRSQRKDGEFYGSCQ